MFKACAKAKKCAKHFQHLQLYTFLLQKNDNNILSMCAT